MSYCLSLGQVGVILDKEARFFEDNRKSWDSIAHMHAQGSGAWFTGLSNFWMVNANLGYGNRRNWELSMVSPCSISSATLVQILYHGLVVRHTSSSRKDPVMVVASACLCGLSAATQV